MLPNVDYGEMPRALQHLLARSQTDEAATMPRRSFLKLAGVAGLALGAFPHLAIGQATSNGQATSALKPTQQPSAFVQIASNGEVTVTVNRLEFGQGVQTALPMILAEELEADWNLVRSRHGSNDGAYLDPLFGIHLTGGSNSIKNSFTQYRELGARARAMLLGAAAARWNVDVTTLRTQAGTVLGPGGRKLGYGELAEAAMTQPVPEKITLKDPKGFRIIGRPTARLDARAKSSGRQNFGIDVRLPGQLTAVVARPPVFGARLASVDDSAAHAVKGVKAVLRVPLDRGAEGVAVVADGYWSAKQGRDALKLQWDTAAVEKLDSERQLAQYRELASRPGPRQFDADMVPLATAPRQLEAEFVFPYLAVRLRLQLAKVYWAIADYSAARHLLREIDDIVLHRPALGTLGQEVSEFRRIVTSNAQGGPAGGSPLTPAELRLLPYLQTHLTMGEIGERLFVSRNTVSSQVTSIYRKLGASSRSQAVARSRELGLLEG